MTSIQRSASETPLFFHISVTTRSAWRLVFVRAFCRTIHASRYNPLPCTIYRRNTGDLSINMLTQLCEPHQVMP